MMYIYLIIIASIGLSALFFTIKIKALKHKVEELEVAKKKADIKADVSQIVLKTREDIRESQSKVDKTTDEIKDRIPKSTGGLTDEEKSIADSITARLDDQL